MGEGVGPGGAVGTGAADRYGVWLIGCPRACHCELRFAELREASSGVVASLPLANPGNPADEVQRDWTHGSNDSSAAMANPHSRHGTEALESGPSGIMTLRILHQQCRVGAFSEIGSVACNLHPVGGGGCAADTQISDGNRQAGRGSVAPNVTGAVAVSRGGDSYPLDRICDLYPVTQVPARGHGLAASRQICRQSAERERQRAAGPRGAREVHRPRVKANGPDSSPPDSEDPATSPARARPDHPRVPADDGWGSTDRHDLLWRGRGLVGQRNPSAPLADRCAAGDRRTGRLRPRDAPERGSDLEPETAPTPCSPKTRHPRPRQTTRGFVSEEFGCAPIRDTRSLTTPRWRARQAIKRKAKGEDRKKGTTTNGKSTRSVAD